MVRGSHETRRNPASHGIRWNRHRESSAEESEGNTKDRIAFPVFFLCAEDRRPFSGKVRRNRVVMFDAEHKPLGSLAGFLLARLIGNPSLEWCGV